MSNSKTIQINPDLFKFSSSDSKSRKKRPKKTDMPKIKVRSKEKPKNNKTLKKNIINMIRKHQELKFKKQNGKNKDTSFEPASKNEFSKNDDVINFNDDFNESVAFLKEMTKKNEEENKIKQYQNNTLKNYSQISEPLINVNLPQSLIDVTHAKTEPFSSIPSQNINKPLNTIEPPVVVNYNHYKPPPPPKFGCLKNGSLPLYKNWKNSTQKNSHVINDQQADIKYTPKEPIAVDSIKLAHANHMRSNIKPFLNRKKNKPKKIRKTIRRTYRVGRSKVKPTVSVLISNRTIRNNITTKKQLLKQIPIEEIRKYLIKHGFIKVGSNSPSDVLRKMYETASMMCGEIHNHNADHVIYNYMNDKSDHF
jgi:hypothetical protein